jgi:hypothetical protein
MKIMTRGSELTHLQQEVLLSQFKHWTGGKTPNECLNSEVLQFMEDYFPEHLSLFPLEASTEYLKKLSGSFETISYSHHS